MSEHVYDEPGINRKVQCDQNNKENVVDIYLSAESLRVYENPWVEGISPNIPRPAEAQHPVYVVREKRNSVRTSVFLGAVCLILLAGIIVLGVQMKKERTHWDAERSQLTANNTKLIIQRDYLWNTFCRQKPKKCRNLPGLTNPD